jgi:rubrerythrin
MIAALRGAVYESLKREEENKAMFDRLAAEARDHGLKEFFKAVAKDTEADIHMLKNLNLHSIVKFGLSIKFAAKRVEINDRLVKSIRDTKSAKECLKVAIDQVNANIEYYEHIADHSVFPETKRLFRIIADKELEHKSRLRALNDMLV